MKEIENDKYCSMIEDLLPLYVEELISRDTKQEIEGHLKNCNKCSEILKTIQKDEKFELEKTIEDDVTDENREQEIKCIKHIKRKIALKIIVSIMVTCIVFIVGINLWNTYRIIRDEDGKWILYNFNTGNIKQGQDYTNMQVEFLHTINNGAIDGIKQNEGNEKDIKYNIIFTFDKKEICISARVFISGYDEEEIQKEYNNCITSRNNRFFNVKIEDQKLYMNDNWYIGKSKEKIIHGLEDTYHNIQIIEF